MKRLLYLCPIFFDGNFISGVEKKVSYQCDCFSKHFLVFLLCYDNKGIVIVDWSSNSKTYLSKNTGGRNVLRNVSRIQGFYDCVYIRYPLCSLGFIKALRFLNKISNKICVEIATYPYESELKKGLMNKVMLLLDRFYRNKMRHYVDRIVTFSTDKIIYKIKTIQTRNGVDYLVVKKAPYIKTNALHLIAVSSVYYLHGYDRIIKGLFSYNKLGNQPEVIFDVVGEGPYLNYYKTLVNELGLQKCVIFHGKRNGSDLDDLYAKAIAAVNSLAIHRENLKNESTIKSKEYAAKGLPIISSSFVDAFSEQDNKKFVLRVSETDDDISIEEIVSFLNILYKNHDASFVREIIRNKSSKVSDINVVLKPIIDYFKDGSNK